MLSAFQPGRHNIVVFYNSWLITVLVGEFNVNSAIVQLFWDSLSCFCHRLMIEYVGQNGGEERWFSMHLGQSNISIPSSG